MLLRTRSARRALDAHPRRRFAGTAVAAVAIAGLAIAGPAPTAQAVNALHGGKIVSADPANFTPHVSNGAVLSIVQLGTKIVAVGTFTSVSQTPTGTAIGRNRIFAFDATTGVIDAGFNPNLDGAANSVDTDGTYLYVGGTFNNVGGKPAKKVAKLRADGTLVTTAAGASLLKAPNGAVNEVVVRGSRLYIGGSFTQVGGAASPRAAFAALDTATGAVRTDVVVPFTGVYDPAIGGGTTIKRMDVTADGRKLVAVGNFSTVGGQSRPQIAVVELPATGAATVGEWATDRYDAAHNDCAGVFDTFMRDIDIAPDGSWFAVTTTGAFAGGTYSDTLCDTTARWSLAGGAGQQPAWVDYTGGDTTYGVAITGDVVYVGGHMRWQNNSFQGDQAGPGAVPREGIAALDAVNGLPLSWNPGRTRGVGAQALYATAQGLWVGSDTTRIGGETHKRIALFPLAGGKTIPSVAGATLPNSFFLAERPAAGAGGVLHRVAAGRTLLARDGAQDWGNDTPYANTGNLADWGGAAPADSTVPSSTPAGIFNVERWDGGDAPELTHSFPVAAGTSVKVRLFFADRCGCTSTVGSRVFDVSIDGVLKLDNFDINAAAGHNVGTMREFTVTSDGIVDIQLGHVVENPLINGIEILDATAAGGTAASGALTKRPVDAAGQPTGSATVVNTAMDWAGVRGAFYLNGTLYYGRTDGSLAKRTFNPATGVLGNVTTVNLYDDPETGERIPFAIDNLTGMFYDPQLHRIYYSVFGSSTLYYRYFTPESEIVGAETFEAPSAGVDFSSVAGMTYASGRIYVGSSADGALRAVPFANGAVTGPAATVSTDGTWRYRAMFVPND